MFDMTDRSRPPAVFVHAWWRTSSTYVWHKLRASPALRCYPEPLHEGVPSLTLPIVRAKPATEALKRMHHPVLDRPPFAEYEHSLANIQAHFRKEFSYDRYFLLPAEPHEELRRYLSGLIAAAHESKQRPLLALVRSSLRAAWMQRTLGGLHVAQLRDPRQQWGSMLDQHRQGTTYFLAGVIAIASKLQSRFPRAFSHLPYRLTDYRGSSYNPAELGHYLAAAQEIDDAQFYALFTLIWIASALQTLSVATLALDCERLSGDASLRYVVEQRFAAAGMPVDFSDISSPSHSDLPLTQGEMQTIEATAIEAIVSHARPLLIANAQRVSARLDELSPHCANLIRRALLRLQSTGFFSNARLYSARTTNTPPAS